jgi:hypothetical protein
MLLQLLLAHQACQLLENSTDVNDVQLCAVLLVQLL